MGRLVYGMHTSLDGFVRDAEGRFDWSEPDPQLHEYFNEVQARMALDVYGRHMWESMRYWQDPPAADLEHPEVRGFAEAWRATDAVVVSRSLAGSDVAGWPRTQLWPELDVGRLRDLVRDTDGDVSIAGPTLAATALRAGLVDEVTAWVNPHVAGGGLRLLPGGWSSSLRLRHERQLPGGVVELAYDVVRGSEGSGT